MTPSGDNPYEAPQTTDLQAATMIPVAEPVGTRELLPEYSTKKIRQLMYASAFLFVHALLLMFVFAIVVPLKLLSFVIANAVANTPADGFAMSLIVAFDIFLLTAIIALISRQKWGWYYSVFYHLMMLFMLIGAILWSAGATWLTSNQYEPYIGCFLVVYYIVSLVMLHKLKPLFNGQSLTHSRIEQEYWRRVNQHVE